MNNIKTKKRILITVLLQILFCILLFVLPLYIMYRSGSLDIQHYSIFFVRTSIFILLFYINYLYLIDKLLFTRKIFLFIVSNLVFATMLVLLQNAIIDVLVNIPAPPSQEMMHKMDGPKGPPNPYMRYWGDMLIIVLVVGFSVALKVTLRWFDDSMNMEKIKAAQLEADLRNLRSQLNPHFLFNTLNNIYSLIAIDNNKAQDAVLRLSKLLRYILYENNASYVPLKQDLGFTSNYIDLMKLRLGENVRLTYSIPPKVSEDKIAPLLFMTLIENAFKHGINNEENSYIDITILVENGVGVICSVENSMSTSNNIESKNSGIGLKNLEKRLELLYPRKHDLIIERRSESFGVRLRIDF